MPRYFFHVRDGDALQEDSEGAVLNSIEEAEDEASLAAREILSEKILNGEVIDGQRFEITDEEGNIVRLIPFRSTLKLD